MRERENCYFGVFHLIPRTQSVTLWRPRFSQNLSPRMDTRWLRNVLKQTADKKNSLSHRVPQKCHVGGDMSHILLIPAMLLIPTKERRRKVPSRSNKFFWGFTASAPTRDLEEMQKGSAAAYSWLVTKFSLIPGIFLREIPDSSLAAAQNWG